MSNAQTITDASFATDVLKSDLPVVVDFWAPWCGPCRMIAPILDELSDELQGKIKIFKMNVDENASTPSQYGVSSIPTLILFKGGKALSTKIGGVSKAKLLEWVQDVL
ncbi:MAG: thioredoxin [Proteobacteria bacterium]|nr:thioredoxin [Pseudomonadota bacterium]